MLIALTFDLSERIYLSNKIWTNFATKIDGIYIIHWSWSFWRKFILNVLFILIVSPNELMIKSVMTYQNIYLISFLNSFSLSFLKKIRKIQKKSSTRLFNLMIISAFDWQVQAPPSTSFLPQLVKTQTTKRRDPRLLSPLVQDTGVN